jgi:hypothetical protein
MKPASQHNPERGRYPNWLRTSSAVFCGVAAFIALPRIASKQPLHYVR